MKRVGTNRLTTLILATGLLSMVLFIVQFPEQSFTASLRGLYLWWHIVFPALLPFYILHELAEAYDVICKLGRIAQPLTRWLFKLPGVSAWTLASGFTAGAPAAAEACAALRKQGLVTRSQGERLLILSHMCSPFFLAIVVSVGFLQSPETAFSIMLIHYGALLILGLLLRFTAEIERNHLPNPELASLMSRPITEQRPLGKLLGDAVTNSIQKLLGIGGLMIAGSVLLRILELAQVKSLAAALLQILLQLTDEPLAFDPVWKGLLELHIGLHGAGEIPVPAMQQLALIGFLLGFGGLTMHALVASAVHGTDLRMSKFIVARLLHGALAASLTILLWEPLHPLLSSSSPAFHHTTVFTRDVFSFSLWPYLPYLGAAWLSILLASSLLKSLFHARR